MGFWAGFAQGFGDQLDRNQRKKEFEETLKQRRIETLASVAAKRQASSIDSYTPEGWDETQTSIKDTPEEVMDTTGTSGGTPTSPSEETGGTSTPKTKEAPQGGAESPSVGVPTNGGVTNTGGYMKAMVYMGADPEKVAKIAAHGGKKALESVYNQLVKNKGDRPYTKVELDAALDSSIITLQKGGRPDLQKLWADLYPNADPLSEGDQKYVSTLLGDPASSVNVLMPWFSTRARDEKPLTMDDKNGIRDQMKEEVTIALNRRIRELRQEASTTQDSDRAAEIASEIQMLETGALPAVKEDSDIASGLKALPPEFGDQIFAPYFKTYPALLEENYFLGSGLQPFADRFKKGETGGGGIPDTFPGEEDPMAEPATDTGRQEFGSEDEVRQAIKDGTLSLPAKITINGRPVTVK